MRLTASDCNAARLVERHVGVDLIGAVAHVDAGEEALLGRAFEADGAPTLTDRGRHAAPGGLGRQEMYLPPKPLAFRLVMWSGLFAWAVWRMSDVEIEIPPPTPEVRVLAPSTPRVSPVSLAPPIVDPAALYTAMQAASGAGGRCGATGATLTVIVGPSGLGQATLTGTVTDPVAACLAAAVWAIDWPRGSQDLETSLILAGARPPAGAEAVPPVRLTPP